MKYKINQETNYEKKIMKKLGF